MLNTVNAKFPDSSLVSTVITDDFPSGQVAHDIRKLMRVVKDVCISHVLNLKVTFFHFFSKVSFRSATGWSHSSRSAATTG